MNTINYQPTGIYKQLVQNPELLAASKENENSSIEKTRTDKIKKTAVKIGIAGAAIGAAVFIRYCKKGFDTIKYKEEIETEIRKLNIEGKEARENTLEDYFAVKAFGIEKRQAIRDKYTAGIKYEKGIAGKVRKALHGISNFFKTYFYGYDKTN